MDNMWTSIPFITPLGEVAYFCTSRCNAGRITQIAHRIVSRDIGSAKVEVTVATSAASRRERFRYERVLAKAARRLDAVRRDEVLRQIAAM